jgi:hypothetical protein
MDMEWIKENCLTPAALRLDRREPSSSQQTPQA